MRIRDFRSGLGKRLVMTERRRIFDRFDMGHDGQIRQRASQFGFDLLCQIVRRLYRPGSRHQEMYAHKAMRSRLAGSQIVETDPTLAERFENAPYLQVLLQRE